MKQNIHSTTGRLIAFHRKAKNVKQEDFASSLGITQSKVSDWENDHRSPTIEELIKIADMLEIHPYILIPIEQTDKHQEYTVDKPSVDSSAIALQLNLNLMNEMKSFYNEILNAKNQTIEILKNNHNLK